ncbi:MAG TPA: hypothetical protein DEB17_06140 [Chlorobaculum sp.]|uniref:Uncharacterized protein n=1 Tax=Chlorobaculum tepidum (strain ATCC 49652 / DSM 12025 / NBRC 103806 / TLS) TaxID=194439 RepID=Q8KD06_CHLTE|nr:hypothetical protein CT1251 [Chlorobaculum tepidum TLS]HBU23562.1 hypothetical protein [Chlorobaculum sp.]
MKMDTKRGRKRSLFLCKSFLILHDFPHPNIILIFRHH